MMLTNKSPVSTAAMIQNVDLEPFGIAEVAMLVITASAVLASAPKASVAIWRREDPDLFVISVHR
jgi:hypothetical protein